MNFNSNHFFKVIIGIFIFLQSCSSISKKMGSSYSPEMLLQQVCKIGEGNKTARGNIWFKARSKEFNGQFPAQVLINNSEDLNIEVTNPFGGTEAFIHVDPHSFEVKNMTHQSGDESRNQSTYGRQYWNQVPLQWAIHFFLGQLPCPSSPHQILSMTKKNENDLTLKVTQTDSNETYTYHFHEEQDQPWPDSLVWEKGAKNKVSVKFSFSEPDQKSLAPKKWEAKSDQGVIQVRWRNREIN